MDLLHSRQVSDYRVTEVGLWTRSVINEVYDLFLQLDLATFACLADLGSGDGRVVLLASLFTRAVGIEADPTLLELSRAAAGRLGLGRAGFMQGDCRSIDLSPYDLLFIFPDKPL
jgi:predicted RNA methylase